MTKYVYFFGAGKAEGSSLMRNLLGGNDATVLGLAAWTKNDRFAWDCYRRFITMFGSVVLGIKRETFDAELDAVKRRLGVASDPDVSPDELRKLTQTLKDIVSARTGAPFPQDPREQLRLAIDAVFDSWFAKKATEYPRLHGIPADWGTAVTVMAMVFGNLGETSGTGVGFTRDPRTGDRHFYAEFLANAQGEDIVAGIRTPEHIGDLRRRMPVIYDELLGIADRLERHYKDMQDIEFTIQEGKLYLLQTRSGKRAAAAAVGVAVDLVRESVIDQHTALLRVPPRELGKIFLPVLDPKDKEQALGKGRLLARGLPAAPGGAVGHVVFNADRAVETVKLTPPQLTDKVREFLDWADRVRTLGVRANADTPEDARKAREFGAEGIGLVRTEHMFFAPERIPIVREMIMAADAASRHVAVKKLLPVP